MQETYTKDEFWAKLDAEGEQKVKINLGRKIYGADKSALAAEWLRSKDEERRAAREAHLDKVGNETLAAAKSAKNAAWAAVFVAGLGSIVGWIVTVLK